jgi:hypothetical protein
MLSHAVSPIADLSKLALILLEEANTVTRMFELVNVGPDFGAPCFFMNGGNAAGGAAGMKFSGDRHGRRRGGQLDENCAYFLDLILIGDDVLVSQQVTESQAGGFSLGLGASVEGAKFGAKLFG